MRVVLISSEFPPGPGGIGTHSWQIARNLARQGLEVKALCPLDYVDNYTAARFDSSEDFEITRWPYSLLKPYRIIRRILCSIDECRNWRACCLLGSASRGAVYAWFVANTLRIPYIAIAHGAEFAVPNKLSKLLVKKAFFGAHRVVCVSNYARQMAEDFGVKKQKIQVIYNGADTEVYHPNLDADAFRKGLGLENRKIILTVGSVSNRKAQDVIIKALPKILNIFPDAFYLVVGLPSKKREYLQLAEELGVAQRVKFTGTVPAETLPLYYNLSDVFVLNSRIATDGENEGFGIVLVEAGLCGKPVVGTRGCGIEEVVVDGETGYLVDPDSSDQTADALIRLFTDPEKANSMGLKGRERALSLFTWERCGREFYDLLASLEK